MTIWEEKLLLLLQDKRSEDPEGFRAYLPDVEQLLRDLAESPPKNDRMYGPKGWQPSPYEDPWQEAVRKMGQGTITADEAAKGLECCANLLLDTPFNESVNRERVESLFLKATGRPSDSYHSETTIPIYQGGTVAHSVPAIRGIHLRLDSNRRLLSIAVDPIKVAEGHSMLEKIRASERDHHSCP